MVLRSQRVKTEWKLNENGNQRSAPVRFLSEILVGIDAIFPVKEAKVVEVIQQLGWYRDNMSSLDLF